MSNKIRIKIDVKKLNKAYFFTSAKGAVYCDLTVIPNKDGAGKYGDTHFVVQDASKEARERGEKGPIVGNGKELDLSARTKAPAPRQTQPTERQQANLSETEPEDVPF
jgi:hypothetical protein